MIIKKRKIDVTACFSFLGLYSGRTDANFKYSISPFAIKAIFNLNFSPFTVNMLQLTRACY